jgi:hypothetical protein
VLPGTAKEAWLPVKVTGIHVARKFNMGNYESYEVGATAELDFGESFDEAFRKLDALILAKKPANNSKPPEKGGK